MALLSILTFFTTLFVLPTFAFSVNTTAPPSNGSVVVAIEETPLATWCFDCGKGMSRLNMANGVSWFCNYWINNMMCKPGTEPPCGDNGGFGGIWVVGDRNLALSVVPFWNELGCGGDWPGAEYNDFFYNETRCYYAFMSYAVDGCNTKGTGHKQGGYSWQYCANVTINPNPDGCHPKDDATAEGSFAPGVQIVKHVATAEDEAAALDLTLQHERYSSTFAIDDAAPMLSKRDGTECYGGCAAVDRSIIEKGIAWFCNKHQGTRISFSGASGGGSLAFADNYTYAEEANDGHPFVTLREINFAVGLNLDNSDNTGCEQEDTGLVVDYNTCAVGLISAVDNCNTDTTSGKQGGILHDQCLQFAVAPLPCS